VLGGPSGHHVCRRLPRGWQVVASQILRPLPECQRTGPATIGGCGAWDCRARTGTGPSAARRTATPCSASRLDAVAATVPYWLSYAALRAGSRSTAYAEKTSCRAESDAAAGSFPARVSGWCRRNKERYAWLISSGLASGATPKMAYRSGSRLVIAVSGEHPDSVVQGYPPLGAAPTASSLPDGARTRRGPVGSQSPVRDLRQEDVCST
jgi:hypothetical protein